MTPSTVCLTTEQLIADLRRAGVRRCYVIKRPDGTLAASHPAAEPLRQIILNSPAFAGHEAVFLEVASFEGFDALYTVFIHSTTRGLAQGGLRLAHYASIEEACFDGLRLAQGMTRKNATARLNWGGGKGLIAVPAEYSNPDLLAGAAREAAIDGYADFVASLGGSYYTAEDVGTKTPDMDRILARNRYVTCVSQAKGGSDNPSPHTAAGVLDAMKAAWQWTTGATSLAGVRVSVQGGGNVGGELVALLVVAGATVILAEPNDVTRNRLLRRFPSVDVVSPDDIFDVDADIFAPCARGAQVNSETIPRLRVRVIVGAANNILEDDVRDANELRRRNIVYVPEYHANRMGIVNCCDEPFGWDPTAVQEALDRVFPETLSLLTEAKERGLDPVRVANERADRQAAEPHPLHPGRGRRIIERVIQSNWAAKS